MASSLPPGTDLCAIPAATPPEGTVSNLVDPPSLHAALLAISIIMTGWSIVFAGGRLYSNKRRLRWADYFAVIALALNVTYTGLILALIKFSRHQWDTPACWYDGWYMKILYAQGTLLGPVIFFAKSAILLLYLQIFTVRGPVRLAVYVGLGITFLTYWPSVPLEAYFAAPHIGERWEDLLVNERPDKLLYWGLVQGSLAVFVDVYIFILPLPPLSRLSMSFRKKVQLLAVFVTALMGVIASTIALVYRVKLRTTKDTTWANMCLFICIIIENNVALIVSSSPAFATFMRVHVSESAIFKSLRSRISRISNSYASGRSSASRVRSFIDPKPELFAHQSPPGPYNELTDLAKLSTTDASDLTIGLRKGDVGIVRNVQIDQVSQSTQMMEDTREAGDHVWV